MLPIAPARPRTTVRAEELGFMTRRDTQVVAVGRNSASTISGAVLRDISKDLTPQQALPSMVPRLGTPTNKSKTPTFQHGNHNSTISSWPLLSRVPTKLGMLDAARSSSLRLIRRAILISTVLIHQDLTEPHQLLPPYRCNLFPSRTYSPPV